MIGELAALGAAITWTVSAILYKKALKQIDPVSANILRLSCTGVFLFALVVLVGKLGLLFSMPTGTFLLAAISGIIGLGFGDTLYLKSLKLIGVARAVPITCTYPLFNLLWAYFMLGQKVTLSVALGALTIIAGIWLLSHEAEVASANLRRTVFVKGLVAALATALLWSLSIAIVDMAVMDTDLDNALIVNTVRCLVIAVLFLALSPAVDRSRGFMKTDLKTIVTLVAGGVVALGIGWFLLAYSFVQTSGSRTVPISSTTPLFSTVVAVLILREEVTARNVLGSMVIVVGIFLIFLFE